MSYSYNYFTGLGNRIKNEDRIHIENISDDSCLFLVADGMGGYDHGDLAADIVIENITTYLKIIQNFNEKNIQKAINKANLAIKQKQIALNVKLGATIAGAVISNTNAVLFWVGDVKIQYLKNEQIRFDSEPHNLISDLKRNKTSISPSQLSRYKHIVTRSISGDVSKSVVSIQEIKNLSRDDKILIYTDGIHDFLDALQLKIMINEQTKIEDALKKIKDYISPIAKDNYSMIGISIN